MNAICILVVSSPRLVNLLTGTVSSLKNSASRDAFPVLGFALNLKIFALRAMPSQPLCLFVYSNFQI